MLWEIFIAEQKSFCTIAFLSIKIGHKRFMVDVKVLIADEADFRKKEFFFCLKKIIRELCVS